MTNIETTASDTVKYIQFSLAPTGRSTGFIDELEQSDFFGSVNPRFIRDKWISEMATLGFFVGCEYEQSELESASVRAIEIVSAQP